MTRNLRFLNLLFVTLFVVGAVTSSAGTLIDVAFTSAPVTSKTGFAATGVTSNDFWNTYDVDAPPLTNLEFVDSSASGAGLTATIPPALYVGTNENGATDPMYGIYVFNEGGNIILNV